MEFRYFFVGPEDRQVWSVHYLEEWMPEGVLSFAHLVNTEEHEDLVLVVKVIFMLLNNVADFTLPNPSLTYDQFGGNKQISFIDADVSFGCNTNKCTIFTKGNGVFNGIADDAIVFCPLVECFVLVHCLQLRCVLFVYV
jgi:hypothetical protein